MLTQTKPHSIRVRVRDNFHPFIVKTHNNMSNTPLQGTTITTWMELKSCPHYFQVVFLANGGSSTKGLRTNVNATRSLQAVEGANDVLFLALLEIAVSTRCQYQKSVGQPVLLIMCRVLSGCFCCCLHIKTVLSFFYLPDDISTPPESVLIIYPIDREIQNMWSQTTVKQSKPNSRISLR